jgi:FAD/FMN-containing dehydrogenase
MTAPVPADVLSRLKAVLGPDGWSDEPERLAPKLQEWRGRWTGSTPILLLPRTTEEVSAAVGICAESGTAITPQGGGTGLVGGQLPQGEVLLSTERLRAVRDVAPLDDVVVVEAGVTLAAVQGAAADANRYFPLSLASEGTATIGGLVSTNAGGTAVLRYGTMRDLVLGIEAVLPNGQVFNGLKRLRKDVSGYDLKQLLIGAEGTLGVVTAASLKLFPVLRSRAVAFAGLRSAGDAIELLARAKAESGGGVEAFELMGRGGLELVLKNIPGQRDPLAEAHPWYVLIETASAEAGGAEAAMERILAAAFEADLVQDAVLAQSETEARALWSLRENHSGAQKPEGQGWKHDISVPGVPHGRVHRAGRRAGRAAVARARAWSPSATWATATSTSTCCSPRGPTGASTRACGRRARAPSTTWRTRSRGRCRPSTGWACSSRRGAPLQVRGRAAGAARDPQRARPQAHHEPAGAVLAMLLVISPAKTLDLTPWRASPRRARSSARTRPNWRRSPES